MRQSHPFLAVRTREIMKWGESEQFRRILDSATQPEAGDGLRCAACGQSVQATWKFCRHCGAGLPGATTSTTRTP